MLRSKTDIPVGPIFRGATGRPINLDNLAARVIIPALVGTGVEWHGWHSFRRGLATSLHALAVPDRDIQGILRHSQISLTQNIYMKSLPAAAVDAMNTLAAATKAGTVLTGNERAIKSSDIVN